MTQGKISSKLASNVNLGIKTSSTVNSRHHVTIVNIGQLLEMDLINNNPYAYVVFNDFKFMPNFVKIEQR